MTQRLTPQLQLDAVERRIDLIRDAEHVSMRQTLEREVRAGADDAWAALTRADRLAQWWGPVSGSLELGGRYEVEGGVSGTVLECAAPHRLALTWEDGGAPSDVVVELQAGAERVRVRLLHAVEIPCDRWTEFGPGATGVGWDLAMLSLQRHLEEGAVEPVETTEWIGTEEARTFLGDSARRWADAAIEAGDDVSEARAAAERTRAFYTGEL